ncbi:class I SAM-dependent methyltransferase [Saccharopolyspora sp. ASAGF58]|uniref:class I SAM-dependent methyltransferase n=1 Tax=Saccharopolyspora sp. ASAGF58 TaxID=2719023 RepID=UPI00143FC0EC|nr:class I SAM-dependent methyltransferase [Saccharopolyspora sp. ASAGF58]QIZ37171.1 class I SAM-dependent methyltransferase [Saccharopolyspora sp. ASAGF58]
MGEIAVAPWSVVEHLLLAAGAGPENLQEAVQVAGLEAVADAIVDELVVRCDPLSLDESVRIGLEITSGAQLVRRTVELDHVGLRLAAVAEAPAVLRFDAVDLLEGLFGPVDGRRHNSREVRWSDSMTQFSPDQGLAGAQRLLAFRNKVSTAVHAVLAAAATRCSDLGALAVRYGSDKWADLHWYTEHYEHHFSRFQDVPVRVLEIGIGGYHAPELGGASLRMWQRYFRRGLVYGLDIFEKAGNEGHRVRKLRGDQSDSEFLADMAGKIGPFDVVIDDGSHVNDHVKKSFHALFPHVRPGGLYVIEDLQTSYWPGYGGRDTEPAAQRTSIDMLKELIDGLHYQERESRRGTEPCYTERNVAALHFYHNLVFVEKGLNAEPAAPGFVPRQALGVEDS